MRSVNLGEANKLPRIIKLTKTREPANYHSIKHPMLPKREDCQCGQKYASNGRNGLPPAIAYVSKHQKT